MEIQTTGQLRQFLCNMIVDIQSGSIEVNKATQIVKTAEQITNSLYAEMKMKQLQISIDQPHYQIGQLSLGDESAAKVVNGK